MKVISVRLGEKTGTVCVLYYTQMILNQMGVVHYSLDNSSANERFVIPFYASCLGYTVDNGIVVGGTHGELWLKFSAEKIFRFTDHIITDVSVISQDMVACLTNHYELYVVSFDEGRPPIKIPAGQILAFGFDGGKIHLLTHRAGALTYDISQNKIINKRDLVESRTMGGRAAFSAFSKNGKYLFVHHDNAVIYRTDTFEKICIVPKDRCSLAGAISNTGRTYVIGTDKGELIVKTTDGATITSQKVANGYLQDIDMVGEADMISFIDEAGSAGIIVRKKDTGSFTRQDLKFMD